MNAKRDQGSSLATKKQLNAVYSKTPEGSILKYVRDIPYDYTGVTEARIGNTEKYRLPPVQKNADLDIFQGKIPRNNFENLEF